MTRQRPWLEQSPDGGWTVMQMLVERKTVAPEHLPDLALSGMTGVELDTANAAVRTLLNLKHYLGGTNRQLLEALAVDIQAEQEERADIAKSPFPIDGRPDPPAA